MPDANRRAFLLSAGLLGASAVTSPTAAAAPAHRPPASDDLSFTFAVLPDIQYLFDEDRGDPAPLDASLRYVLGEDVAFMAQLGDLTEHGRPGEFDQVSRSFSVLDRRRFPYSVLAGNHDVDSSTDDQRGDTPYRRAFGPQRFRFSPSFRGATPDGYNSYHVFRAAGREWLVLALDWRPSAAGIAWANRVIAEHPRLPVILTTHDLVTPDSGAAALSDAGKRLWDGLIAGNDQIFLTLNGHYWPPASTTLRNRAGNDVHLHITNYQDRFYGGSAMIRTYRFDLARGVIDVRTFSPWLRDQSPGLNALQRKEVERSGPEDYFSIPIDFERRFAGFAPVPVPAPKPPRQLLVPGTVAYWRFDGGSGPVRGARDLSGRGNDLVRAAVPGTGDDALTYDTDFDRGQPSHASLRFRGSRNPARGAYLKTVASAPLNNASFDRGYTIEAFVKPPADFRDGNHAWCGIVARLGTGGAAGKTGDDPSEPAATLSLSDGAAFQWALFPSNQNGIATNWGHELPLDAWCHVAVVNDGWHTTMYVDGCQVVRNPRTPSRGIANPGGSWLVGASAYDGVVEQSFYGWLGDVRIADRALSTREFMR